MSQDRRSSGQKLLSILAAFTEERPFLSVSELRQVTGLPQSSVYRFLSVLRDDGFVEPIGDGLYTLGPALLALGRAALRGHSYSDVFGPVMDELSLETGETVILVRRSGLHAVCIDRRESRHHLSLSFEVGQVMDLALGAVAKVVLAHSPVDVQEQYLCQVGSSDRRTALARELDEIRVDGYSESLGEVDEGIWGIAVPVFLRGGEVLGLSIAAPHARMGKEARSGARAQIMEAGAQLSLKLR